MSTLKKQHIFISYSHEDTKMATILLERFKVAQIPFWIDTDKLVPGTSNWEQTIREAIRDAIAIVVVASPTAATSEYVSAEIKIAKSYKHKIFPIWIDGDKWIDCIPLGLANTQYIDCRKSNLSGGLYRLIKTLTTYIETTVKTTHIAPVSNPQTVADTPQKIQASPSVNLPNLSEDSPVALVIEDMSDYQTKLADLMRNMGMVVHVAQSSNEAITMIHNNVDMYALVTLDMQLGPNEQFGQGGVFLLKYLKRYQEDAVVIIITQLSHWDQFDVSEFFTEDKVNGMFQKPIDEAELQRFIRKHIGNLKRE